MSKFKLLLLSSIIGMSVSLSSFSQSNMSLLFVQTSKSALITPVKNKPGVYHLTLKNPDKFVSYFSDRPERVTGMVPIQKFLASWKDGKDSFKNNPPNVALETSKKESLLHKNNETIVGTLSNPQYQAKTGNITYTFKLLKPQKISLKKSKLNYTVLFIDDEMVHWRPGGY